MFEHCSVICLTKGCKPFMVFFHLVTLLSQSFSKVCSTSGIYCLVDGQEWGRERRRRHAVNGTGLGFQPETAASRTLAAAYGEAATPWSHVWQPENHGLHIVSYWDVM